MLAWSQGPDAWLESDRDVDAAWNGYEEGDCGGAKLKSTAMADHDDEVWNHKDKEMTERYPWGAD